jgi:hypothetical protein
MSINVLSYLSALHSQRQSRSLSMIPAYEAMSVPFKIESKLVSPQEVKETTLKNGIKVLTSGQFHPVSD